jgi:beta-ureidopropionase / N-carbamoyl-L-amino-acid hydrolase
MSSPATPQIDSARLLASLEALSRIGLTPSGGVNRAAYNEADREAREVVRGLMREAGLEVSVDAAGNTIGRRAGSDPTLPPVVLGSHTDSVPEGGHFDGPLGVLSAIEVTRTLSEREVDTRHPLEVVNFQNEEGGLVGSRAWIGAVGDRDLALTAVSGKTIAEGIALLGGDASALDTVRREPGAIAAYVELHIEQGSTLERAGAQIGVVAGIVGIRQWEAAVNGVASHAGTTPMDDRHDALLAAARFIDAVHRVVTAEPGRQVGTVGRIRALPGAANVIPGEVVMTLELRDLDEERILALYERAVAAAADIAVATGTSFDFRPTLVHPPALMSERVRSAITDAASSLGLRAVELPSGAGHDAQNMARLGPAGMVFVPSVGGVSHSPREYTRGDDVVNGANVLLETVLRLDEGFDSGNRGP